MKHDLTFVALERRDEVQRRIEAIERFLAHPGRATAEQCAADLGLRHAQFYNLVRAWRASRRPEAVDAGRRPGRGSSMSEEQQRVIDDVIAVNARASVGDLIDLIMSAAKAGGVNMPHREAVVRSVRNGRPSLLPDGLKNDLDLLVDHTVLDLPVDYDGEAPRRPLATMVIDVANDAIVGLVLSRGAPRPEVTAAALVDAARRGLRNQPRPSSGRPRIAITAMSGTETAGLLEPLGRAGLETQVRIVGGHGSGLAIEALLGSHRAGIWLKPRLVWRYPKRRLIEPSPGRRALTPDEASALAGARLMDARVTRVFGRLEEGVRIGLVSDLSSLAQSAPDP